MRKKALPRVAELYRKEARLRDIKIRSTRTASEIATAKLLTAYGIKYREQRGVLRGAKEFVIADFYLPRRRTVIEIDGGYHNTQEQRRRDRVKDSIYTSRGWDVLRFTNWQVSNTPGVIISAILKLDADRGRCV